jgi:hypothetical protein
MYGDVSCGDITYGDVSSLYRQGHDGTYREIPQNQSVQNFEQHFCLHFRTFPPPGEKMVKKKQTVPRIHQDAVFLEWNALGSPEHAGALKEIP